jgi:large subunit ribosomal protein L1
MAKLTKRAKAIQGKVDPQKLYPVADALNLVKECAVAKFDESIDVASSSASTPRSPIRWFAVRS